MNWKKIAITVLRVAIGWHFIFEGILKVIAGNWSAAGYLTGSTGPFSGFYQWLGASESLMKIIDPANMLGLILIGLGLFIGVAIRISSISGIVLLMLYYFAYPPFGGAMIWAAEGSLYIVNKNLIEAMILLVFIFMKEKGYGIYALKSFFFKKKKSENKVETEANVNTRRDALKNLATIPVLGIIGLGAFQETKRYGIDTLSGATIKIGATDISELKGELPKGKIGKHEISRLVMGGNLIGGFAHARDLIYVSALFRAYNNEKKIFETLMLAEEAGINTINITFSTLATLQKYKKITGSKIKVISQVGHDRKGKNHFENIDKAIDSGVDIIQVIGNATDILTRDGQTEVVGEMLDYIRSQGFTAGLGAHSVESLQRCKDAGIIPDYYMKTMHHDNYWSAHPQENRTPYEVVNGGSKDRNYYNNNLWCSYPDKTAEFVKNAVVPVMGFKVLAAGAIKPEDGFKWALQNGADFICVGMFDFQVVNNVITAIDVLNNLNERTRKWYG